VSSGRPFAAGGFAERHEDERDPAEDEHAGRRSQRPGDPADKRDVTDQNTLDRVRPNGDGIGRGVGVPLGHEVGLAVFRRHDIDDAVEQRPARLDRVA